MSEQYIKRLEHVETVIKHIEDKEYLQEIGFQPLIDGTLHNLTPSLISRINKSHALLLLFTDASSNWVGIFSETQNFATDEYLMFKKRNQQCISVSKIDIEEHLFQFVNNEFIVGDTLIINDQCMCSILENINSHYSQTGYDRTTKSRSVDIESFLFPFNGIILQNILLFDIEKFVDTY